MSRAAYILILLLLLTVPAATAIPALVITQPSPGETQLAEVRDFYVYGIFTGTVPNPGDIRIEIFPGDAAAGTPVRTIRSHVDPASGITNASVINQSYCAATGYCTRMNGAMVPDIVELPGGTLDPANKLVVTSRYYLGMIQGGVTKGFETNYTDGPGGAPLADLTAGNYTIRVTGLTGSFAGQAATRTITLGLTSATLGLFRPQANKDAMTRYAVANGRRTIYNDWFPGYFTDLDNGSIWWESPRRWTPNNGIEVVNDRPGTLIDTPTSADNALFIYNLNAGSTTYSVELSGILKNGLADSPATSFVRYDIGEPAMTYNDASAGVRTLTGNPVPFPAGRRLVLYRAEIVTPNGASRENLYDPNDFTTPKLLNFDPAGGITVPAGNEFVLYGATKPIPSAVAPTATPYRFTIANRIAAINCTITDGAGRTVSTGMHDVNLSRLYNTGSPQRFNSLWEFGIEVAGLTNPGTYMVSLAGVDVAGNPVAQTDTTFTVTIPQPASGPDNSGDGSSAPSSPQSVVIPGARAGAAAVFAIPPVVPAGTVSVSSVTLVPSRDTGQAQCIVSPATPGAALQLAGMEVAGYERIDMNWVSPDAIDHADIAFTVSKPWVDAHAASPYQIVLMRYTGDRWVELPTRFDSATVDPYRYVATTPGFSLFAVAVKADETPGTPAVTPVSTSPPEGAAGVPGPAPVATINPGPATQQAVSVTTTAVPAVVPASQNPVREILFPSAGIPLVTILAWASVIVLIVICVLLVRRWWIRRQNPALF